MEFDNWLIQDLDLQNKKLEQLKTLDIPAVMIDNQIKIIADMEERIKAETAETNSKETEE